MISAPWPGWGTTLRLSVEWCIYTRPSQDRCEPCSTQLSSGAGLSMACATVSPTQVFTCSAACTKWSPSGSTVLNVASLRASDVTLHHHLPLCKCSQVRQPTQACNTQQAGGAWQGQNISFVLKAWWGTQFLSSKSLMRDNISFIWKTDKDMSFTWKPEKGHFSSESLMKDISFIWKPDEGQHFFHLKAWWGTFLSSESLMRDISFIWKPDEGYFFHLKTCWGDSSFIWKPDEGHFFHLKAWWRNISFIWKPDKRQQFIHLRRRRASLWQWMVKQRQTNTKLKCSNPISKAHT